MHMYIISNVCVCVCVSVRARSDRKMLREYLLKQKVPSGVTT